MQVNETLDSTPIHFELSYTSMTWWQLLMQVRVKGVGSGLGDTRVPTPCSFWRLTRVHLYGHIC